ncbi:hypothetical protein [Kitasatospora sp. NPDC054795]
MIPLSSPARARHFGVASRDELLLHCSDTHSDDLYDNYGGLLLWLGTLG